MGNLVSSMLDPTATATPRRLALVPRHRETERYVETKTRASAGRSSRLDVDIDVDLDVDGDGDGDGDVNVDVRHVDAQIIFVNMATTPSRRRIPSS
jgi:hypothetical protein